MIQLTGAGKRYGPRILFENVDWLVTPNERVGIVGANGAGKSSLLKVLAGIEGLDSGSIATQKGVSIGYLPQEGLSLSGRSVFAECMTVFADLRALEDEQEQLARRMAELDPESAEYAQVAERFHRAEGEFRARDGYAIDAQVGSVLSGLGFPQRDWKRRTEEFSGGWQMRIALAKLLLERPNLLLLDEPTNHLDLEARNWLEEYLTAYPYAFVLVSHDRYFLDVTVRKIGELWNKNLHFYTGGYTRYDIQKTERRAQLQAAYNNQQDRIRQIEAFITRFRYQATKAKQVQSRIKELARIEKIEALNFGDAPGRARRIVRHGDIIWSTVRPNRRSYALIVNPEPNLIVSTGFAVLTAKTVPFSYLYLTVTTDEFADYLTNHATGSAYPAVTGKEFERAQLVVPPKSLRDRFHEATEPMLNLSWCLHQRNTNLRTTRDFLLPKLISGEIPVEAAAELVEQTA